MVNVLKEVISGEIGHLPEVKERIRERTVYRKNRHKRLRYRKVRTDNRRKPEGLLAKHPAQVEQPREADRQDMLGTADNEGI